MKNIPKESKKWLSYIFNRVKKRCEDYSKEELKFAIRQLIGLDVKRDYSKEEMATLLNKVGDEEINDALQKNYDYKIPLTEGYYTFQLIEKINLFENLLVTDEDFSDRLESEDWQEYAIRHRQYSRELERLLRIFLFCDSEKIKSLLEIEYIMTSELTYGGQKKALFDKKDGKLLKDSSRMAQLIEGRLLNITSLIYQMYNFYFHQLDKIYETKLEDLVVKRTEIPTEAEKEGESKIKQIPLIYINEDGYIIFNWGELSEALILNKDKLTELYNILISFEVKTPIAQLWENITIEVKQTLIKKFEITETNLKSKDKWFKLSLDTKYILDKKAETILEWFDTNYGKKD